MKYENFYAGGLLLYGEQKILTMTKWIKAKVDFERKMT